MRILITGGGTGGHLYPGIAVADAFLQTMDCDLLFVGTKHGLEARVVPEKDFNFKTVWISGMHRGRFFRNLLFPLKMFVSLFQSVGIVTRFRPDIVLGTGGYVSWPVLMAARLMKKRTVLQEQNLAPGLVTRLLAGGADRVFLSFEASKSWFKNQDNLTVCGNPTRDDLENGTREEGLNTFGLDETKKTLFVFGGSQGARGINEGILGQIDALMKDDDLQILWATGPRWVESIEQRVSETKRIKLLPYIMKMDSAYAVSDLVVCRAGATTVAELTRLGKPAIFIPLPSAAAGHQESNARILKKADAAEMILESELTDHRLTDTILELLSDRDRLRKMGENARRFGKPDAAERIKEDMINIVKSVSSL